MADLYYMVFTTSLFILVVILLRRIIHKKVSMRLQYALWLLVAAKLLLFPVPRAESFLSAQNLSENLKYGQLERNREHPAETDSRNPAPSVPKPENTYNPGTVHTDMISNTDTGKTRTETATQEDGAKHMAYKICTGAAKAGSILMFVYFLAGNIRFAVYLYKRRTHFAQEEIPLAVYLVRGLPSPCLYGKAVYLTPEMAEEESRRRHMLTHEYCHYRQGDLFWSVLRSLCVILYWWNPLVWLAAYLSKQDCELACDEAALKRLGEGERISYGSTLIGLVTKKTKPKDYFLVTTTMTGGKNMKLRITKIAQKSKVVLPVCIFAVLAATVCLVSVSTLKPSGRQTKLQPVKQTAVGKGDVDYIKKLALELTLEPVSLDMGRERAKNNFFVTADFQDGNIVLMDVADGTRLASIEEKYDEGGLFLSMADENTGYVLYCSTPGAGQMMKLLYATNDRWNTYREMDISSQIDGYPLGMSAGTAEHVFIGAQMRSNGSMFETADGGKSWNPVVIDESLESCRYAFVSDVNRERGISYALLAGDEFYALYQSDAQMSVWKPSGIFTLESEYDVEAFFLHDGIPVIADSQKNQYRLKRKKSGAVQNLDDAAGNAILSYNAENYGSGECAAEGHVLLGNKQEGAQTTVYALTMYGEYGFENGGFVKVSGTGVIPAVIVLSYDEKSGYKLQDFKYPKDGGEWLPSVHEMFPEQYWDRCVNKTEDDRKELERQEQVYAKDYLKRIGRNAKIGEYEQDYRNYPLLTDAGASIKAVNRMDELLKYRDLYPYWIGNFEKIEDGVRYVYATALDQNAGEIICTKTVYDTGKTVEQLRFDMYTGEEIK